MDHYIAQRADGTHLHLPNPHAHLRRFRTVAQAARALQLDARPRVYRIQVCCMRRQGGTGKPYPIDPCVEVWNPGETSCRHYVSMTDALDAIAEREQ